MAAQRNPGRLKGMRTAPTALIIDYSKQSLPFSTVRDLLTDK
jgi:hypothetical protein